MVLLSCESIARAAPWFPLRRDPRTGGDATRSPRSTPLSKLRPFLTERVGILHPSFPGDCPLSKRKTAPGWDQMPIVHPHAAGLDIGATEIWVCVPSSRDPEPVRCFPTFTPDLQRLADWLVACGIDTVAMESTMQKALQHMNLLLRQVLSDVTGETGLQIIRAIIAGQRDPVQLARLRNPNCKSSEDEIAKALTGNYAPEHLFTITQALELFDFYTQQVAACDAELERRYAAMKPRWDGPDELPDVPPVKKDSHSKNQPAFNVRAHLLRLIGVDLVGVMGLSASTVQTLLSEIGTDMSRFPSEKHLASWLGLAPHHEISGGKILRNGTLKGNHRAAQAFRQAAQSVARSHSALGAYYRRQRTRLGEAQAIMATAHKIARTVYHLLKHREAFIPESAADYEARLQQRELAQLKRKAAKLGLSLVPVAQAT